MTGTLHKNDKYLIGVGLLLSIIGGVMGQLDMVSIEQELMLSYVAFLPIIPALIFIWLARDLWGGHVARYLELIGIGLGIHLVLWVPHIRWHILAEHSPDLTPPAWLGFDAPFWYVFYHGFSLLAFALMTYGFYLFWKEGAGGSAPAEPDM